jgi:phosphoribosylanthranilate isomerase
MRVKICGITRLDDALACADLGIDAIGLNFAPMSKRRIGEERAAKIVSRLPPFIWAVGVFVNATETSIRRTISRVGLHAVQLHGDEPLSFGAKLGVPILRSVAVGEKAPRTRRPKHVSCFVLDAAQVGHGGGGKTFDWKLAKAFAKKHPTLLAGGLDDTNVAEAIRIVRPLGVDVASGVERSPGIKDPRKLARFVRAARSIK